MNSPALQALGKFFRGPFPLGLRSRTRFSPGFGLREATPLVLVGENQPAGRAHTESDFSAREWVGREDATCSCRLLELIRFSSDRSLQHNLLVFAAGFFIIDERND